MFLLSYYHMWHRMMLDTSRYLPYQTKTNCLQHHAACDSDMLVVNSNALVVCVCLYISHYYRNNFWGWLKWYLKGQLQSDVTFPS